MDSVASALRVCNVDDALLFLFEHPFYDDNLLFCAACGAKGFFNFAVASGVAIAIHLGVRFKREENCLVFFVFWLIFGFFSFNFDRDGDRIPSLC